MTKFSIHGIPKDREPATIVLLDGCETYTFDNIQVNGEEVLAAPITWQGSHEQTAKAIADAINAGGALGKDAYARANGSVVEFHHKRGLWTRLWNWIARLWR